MFHSRLPLDVAFVVAGPLTYMVGNHVLDDHITWMLDHVRMLEQPHGMLAYRVNAQKMVM